MKILNGKYTFILNREDLDIIIKSLLNQKETVLNRLSLNSSDKWDDEAYRMDNLISLFKAILIAESSTVMSSDDTNVLKEIEDYVENHLLLNQDWFTLPSEVVNLCVKICKQYSTKFWVKDLYEVDGEYDND